MEVQKTALYNYHKDLGAKFVSFAGYEMPIQYKDGIVKEHIYIELAFRNLQRKRNANSI